MHTAVYVKPQSVNKTSYSSLAKLTDLFIHFRLGSLLHFPLSGFKFCYVFIKSLFSFFMLYGFVPWITPEIFFHLYNAVV